MRAVGVGMAIDQFVNGRIYSLVLGPRWAAGQRDAVAGHQAGVQEPEERLSVLEVAHLAAVDLLDATAPKACAIALFQPYVKVLIPPVRPQQPRLACHPNLANDSAQTLGRSPSIAGYPPPRINQPLLTGVRSKLLSFDNIFAGDAQCIAGGGRAGPQSWRRTFSSELWTLRVPQL